MVELVITLGPAQQPVLVAAKDVERLVPGLATHRAYQDPLLCLDSLQTATKPRSG